jgi:hypothetical protein
MNRCCVCNAWAPHGRGDRWYCGAHVSDLEWPLSAARLEGFLGAEMAAMFARERERHEQAVVDWIAAHWPRQTDPTRCLHCGREEDRLGAGTLIPIGWKNHVWMHRQCHDPWRAKLRAQAVEALTCEAA